MTKPPSTPAAAHNTAATDPARRKPPLARSLPQALHVQPRPPKSSTSRSLKSPEPTHLASRLFVSHGVLAAILLVAVTITLSGLFGMNVMLAEVKDRHLADFEADEQLHRAAWAIETKARHGITACERPDANDATRAQIAQGLADATSELGVLLQRSRSPVSTQLTDIATGYFDFGRRVAQGDVCQRLGDPALNRQRLLLDEKITDAWIDKLKQLRLAILDKEQAAQWLGTWTSVAGVSCGVIAFVVAACIARFVARSVTVPLSLLAGHARRVGEGDFSRLPTIDGPYEVAQLSHELERMRARLSEVNQLKEAFLGSVSHDLRTPLAHMREALGLLTDGTLGALTTQQHRVAELAMRACEREIRLVSALLDLSRIRTGRPLMLTPGQQIDDVIENALEHVHDDAQRAGVEINVTHNEQAPTSLLDTMLIEAALVNVLSNAIIASPRGGRVRVHRDVVNACERLLPRPGPWLQIAVSDEGPGVDAELREKIFEPFFTKRLSPSAEGSGLGLPLAREMIRGHGGELALIDGAAGATFAIWLPISHATAHDAHSHARIEPPPLTSSAEHADHN